MNIVFGTENVAKLHEVQLITNELKVTVVGLHDIGIQSPDIAETGSTFEENACIKYHALRRLVPKSNLLVTDDGGIGIDALNGEPGVHSRRWNDERREMSDDEIIQKVITSLKGKRDRTARFVICLAYGFDDEPKVIQKEFIGEMLEKPKELPKDQPAGFPYRAYFYIPQIQKMLFEIHDIPMKERPNVLTHREQAWLQLLNDAHML